MDDRATRIYRRLLILAPPTLRRRHAGEMAAVFSDALEAARPRGRAAIALVWVYATADLFAARGRSLITRRRPVVMHDHRRPIMFGTDLRYTCRWLARQKFSTSLVVAMLALGVGANVVVFSLVDGLFLRPLPLPQQDRLVYVNETAPRWDLERVGINFPDFVQWREHAELFDAIGMWEGRSFNLSDGSRAERIEGAGVTYDFAAALGVEPVLGRMFTAAEDAPGGPAVVLIGDSLWRGRFARAPDVVGRTLRLNNVAHTIVGVLPPAAEFPSAIKLWVPMAGDPAQPYQSYASEGAIGRLRAGVTVEAAERELLRAQQTIWDERDTERIVSPYARPLRDELSRGYALRARALAAGTLILILVACANVASVMLARALARRREMSIRLAVGASRTRLATQLFVENMVLSVLGAALGLILGRVALALLLASAGDQVPAWATFTIDWRLGVFTGGIALVSAVLFGWAPAFHAVGSSLQGALQTASTRGTSAGRGRRTLSILVGAEFALAAVLLVCAGLLVRAYDRVQRIDPGFRTDHVLTFGLSLPESAYGDQPGDSPGARALAFWDRLTARLAALPGVEDAGVITCAPLGCHSGMFYEIEGREPLPPGQSDPVTLFRPTSPGYFSAIGIRLQHGRFFDDRDGDRQAVIVNETFARTFWPGVEDPVGRRIRRRTGGGRVDPWMTVVGMVQDVQHYGLERLMRPGIYVPLRQAPRRALTAVLRTSVEPESVVAAARAVVRDLDPDLAMYRVQSMETAVRRSMSDRRTYSWLLGVFALIALALALGGTYGVTTYLVSQRTREIGIRVALGARAANISRIVMQRSLVVVGTGLVAGAAGSVLLARQLEALLFGVAPHDPTVLATASIGLLIFAALANAVPAWRAARVDPIATLRAE